MERMRRRVADGAPVIAGSRSKGDRQTVIGGDGSAIDAHEVYPGIWVGSVPPRGPRLAGLGFTHVVLCAEDFQFPAGQFSGVKVVHCPYEDKEAAISNTALAMIFATARLVSEVALGGGRVLVTCAAGINRSALCAALAMRMLGVSGSDAVDAIRARRYSYCLSNEVFLRLALGTSRVCEFYLPTK